MVKGAIYLPIFPGPRESKRGYLPAYIKQKTMKSKKNISVSELVKLRSHFKTIERQSFISNFGFKNTFWISFIFLARLVNVGVFTS